MNELLLRRRALMMVAKKSRLPSAYQEVEYLESPGEAYFYTNQKSSDDLCFKIRFSAKSTDDFTAPLFTGTSGDGKSSFGVSFYQNAILVAPRKTNVVRPQAQRYPMVYDIELTSTDILLDGFIVDSRDRLSMASSKNISVFTASWDNTSNLYYFIGLIYYVLLYTSQQKVCELIPCYRKSDNKPGMYDLVTKTFFTNAGTGEFIVGADVK